MRLPEITTIERDGQHVEYRFAVGKRSFHAIVTNENTHHNVYVASNDKDEEKREKCLAIYEKGHLRTCPQDQTACDILVMCLNLCSLGLAK